MVEASSLIFPATLLPSALWMGAERSRELTPLYVDRYRGPHDAAVATAHAFPELLLVMRGEGRLEAGGDPLPLRPGRLVLIPAHLPHRERSLASMDVVWAGLGGTRAEALAGVRALASDEREAAQPIEQLWLLARQRGSGIGGELDALARLALARVLRFGLNAPPPGADLVDQVVAFLHQHLACCPSAGWIAAKFGVSQGYFFRAFRRRMGLPPLAYLARVRLDHALRLLEHGSLSVSQVARLVGYPDPLYFSKAFRRRHGLNPSQARALRR